MVRWWWFSPTVTREELDRELTAMTRAWFGGVEVAYVYPLAPASTGSATYSTEFELGEIAVGERVLLNLGCATPAEQWSAGDVGLVGSSYRASGHGGRADVGGGAGHDGSPLRIGESDFWEDAAVDGLAAAGPPLTRRRPGKRHA
jgi:hypothetical protein